MLTRSKPTPPRVQVPDVDLASFARSAGDLANDVPRLVEEGMDRAADAIGAAAAQFPGRPRRSPMRPWAPAMVIVGLVALLAVTGWWMARSGAISTARDLDRELDEEALARAASDGMADQRADHPGNRQGQPSDAP